jgi:hypothetical protein
VNPKYRNEKNAEFGVLFVVDKTSSIKSICSVVSPTAIRIIAIVTFQAGGGGQVDGVARAAALAAMVDTTAALTSNARVWAVIYGRNPGTGVMALGTGLSPEHPGMEARIVVAAGTCAGCAFEDVIDVAFFAGNLGVSAIQFERRKVMVEGGITPIGGGMAGAAFLAKFTVVLVILFVAGKTVRGCALVDAVEVTFTAFYAGVFAFEFKG